jgi:succinate dehydrogenase / fumarate reductase flavoprotein subunit
LLVSECIARAALIREESRGGHTREDFPKMSSEWRKVNLECSFDGNSVSVNKRALPEMREDLLNLFEVDELKKYMTEPELQRHAKGAQA